MLIIVLKIILLLYFQDRFVTLLHLYEIYDVILMLQFI